MILQSRRFHLLLIAIGIAAEGCGGKYLLPDKSRALAYVTTNRPIAAGLVPAGSWKDDAAMPRPGPPSSPCPREKEELEAALGLTAADACGDIRRKDAPGFADADSRATGSAAPPGGDGDAPIASAVAPHCYPIGKHILVVEYERRKTQCSRIVGMAFLQAK
jgi:hypothetical protein